MKTHQTHFSHWGLKLRATIGTAVVAVTFAASGAGADVPDVLQAQGGGAPPGYSEPTFFDPAYEGDDGLVSYNDPFAGQSDAALKAKIGDLSLQVVFSNPTGYNAQRGRGTQVQTALRRLYSFSQRDPLTSGSGPRGIQTGEWADVVGGRDTTTGTVFREVTVERRVLDGAVRRGSGYTPLDILAHVEDITPGTFELNRRQPNVGELVLEESQSGEYLVGSDFYWALERDGVAEWDEFLETTRPRRQSAQANIEKGLGGVRASLASVAGDGRPTFDPAAYAQVRRGLEEYRATVQAEVNLLRPRVARARQTVEEAASILEQRSADAQSTFPWTDPEESTDLSVSGFRQMAQDLRARTGMIGEVYSEAQRELNEIDAMMRQLQEMQQINRRSSIARPMAKWGAALARFDAAFEQHVATDRMHLPHDVHSRRRAAGNDRPLISRSKAEEWCVVCSPNRRAVREGLCGACDGGDGAGNRVPEVGDGRGPSLLPVHPEPGKGISPV